MFYYWGMNLPDYLAASTAASGVPLKVRSKRALMSVAGLLR